MGKKVFVINAATLSATLATDGMALYENGVAAASFSASLSRNDRMAFGQTANTSMELPGKTLVNVATQVYDAGTAQVSSVELPNAVDDFVVRIFDTTEGTEIEPYDAFQGTAAEIAAAITAAGTDQNDNLSGYSATDSGATVTITAELDHTFRIAADEGSTITYTTNMEPSVGTPEKVAALESYGWTYDGRTNLVGFPVIQPDSKVDTAEDYDIVIATFANPITDKTGNDGYVHEPITIYFCCAKSGAGDTSMAAALVTEIEKMF